MRSAAFARPIPSVHLSDWNIRSTAKTVRETYCYYGEPIGSCTVATKGTHLQPHTTTPFPIGRFVRFPYLLIITSIIKAVLVVLCLSVLCVQDLESEMTSQRTVLESLNVTGRQMSRGGSSSNTGDSGGDGGGALLAQLEDMNQRSSSLATRAAEIRSECAGIWW